MRFTFLILLSVLGMSACSHPQVNASSEQGGTVVVANNAYALVTPVASGASIPPSNPCAASFDDVITHLEKLMADKAKANAQVTISVQ